LNLDMAILRCRAVCRPGGAQRKWGGIHRSSPADSDARAMRGQVFGRACDHARHAYPGFAGQRVGAASSVVLKMNTVIRLASAFLRSPGVGMRSGLRGPGNISAEVLPCAPWGISPQYVAPSTCMGPPPDRKSRAVSRFTSGGTRGAQQGPTQPCAARSACSKG
jgi:hypothetical protein